MTEDESYLQIRKGKYIWDNNRANIFLDNLQSESVHEQLNGIAENSKQAISNAEVDLLRLLPL